MDHPSILGLDVAKSKLDLCFSPQPGQEHPAQVPNTTAGLDSYLAAHPEVAPDSVTVGMESTGDYHLLAARYFLEKGFAVKIINPILTRQYVRSTIRGAKTDKSDAALICKIVREGHGNNADLSKLLNENREMLRLSRTLTQYAVQLKQHLDVTRRKHPEGKHPIEKKLLKLIKETEAAADDLVDRATEHQTPAEQYIDSIPGFATKLSAIVVNEIGDINRFDSPASLVAFSGLDPKLKESGRASDGRGRITKRGSPYLRETLWLAANVARQFDSELKAYYDKKRAEGRHNTEVLCIIARKLIYRIWAVWKGQRTYERHPITLSTKQA